MAFQLDNPDTRGAALESLAILSWKILMVDFEYDHSDGEVRPTIDFPIEDGTLTLTQLRRCLMTLPHVLEDFCSPIYHAMETGEVHPSLMENDLESAIQQIEGPTADEDEEDLQSNLDELRSLLEQISNPEGAIEALEEGLLNTDNQNAKKEPPTPSPDGDDSDGDDSDEPDLDWI